MATNRPKLKFLRGSTYTFDVSNADLATHPFKFTADSGSTEYTNGVTLTGTQGQAGAEITFVVPENAPTNLNYYCGTHGMGMGNHIFIPPLTFIPESDGSFLSSAYRSHYNVTAASGTLYTGSNGTVYFMAVDEGVPPTNEDSNSFFTDSDITISIDSDYLYGGGHGDVFNIQTTLTWGGARGLRLGGYPNNFGNLPNSRPTNIIDYWSMAVGGNATDFGDMTQTNYSLTSSSSGTRVVSAGGWTHGTNNYGSGNRVQKIEYITPSVLGNGTDFGNLLNAASGGTSASDGNRMVIMAFPNVESAGGYGSDLEQGTRVETILMATPGNSTDFTDLARPVAMAGAWNDKTRVVIGGGAHNAYKPFNQADGTANNSTASRWYQYFAIATGAGAATFGEMTATDPTYAYHIGRKNYAAGGDTTRAIFGGGEEHSSAATPFLLAYTNVIEYITIQTTGNGTDFGDLNDIGMHSSATANDGTSTHFIGGREASYSMVQLTTINKVVVQTPGNAYDFGDLTLKTMDAGGASGNAA